ncbi:MAG: hypothetical protein R3236_03125, partial [Phycisphaeraceae bacterium]|nr:hypothetical protein [Phycisphaeraceae bacterium]
RGQAASIRTALNDAQIGADQIDLILPLGSAIASYDQAEAAALRSVFGDRLSDIPIVSTKACLGLCGAGVGALDAAVGAMALAEQKIPARINCDEPIDGMESAASAPATDASLRHVLVSSSALGGQNVALILRRAD